MAITLRELSVLGAGLVLFAYILNQIRYGQIQLIDSGSKFYKMLNISGAILILLNAIQANDPGPILINAVWIAVPLALALINVLRISKYNRHSQFLFNTYYIKRNLPINKVKRTEYTEAWKSMLRRQSLTRDPNRDGGGENLDAEVQKLLFEHMYNNLNILDGKTNSLLQISSILVAAYIFLFGQMFPNAGALLRQAVDNIQYIRLQDLPGPLILGVLYSITSVLFCMSVIWVHWSSEEELKDAENHIETLVKIRTRRTIFFRRSWTFCLAAMFLVLLHMGWLLCPTARARLDEAAAAVCGVHLTFLVLFDGFLQQAVEAARKRSAAPSPAAVG